MHAPSPSQPHEQSAEFLELYRAGLKSAVDLMQASVQNAERLSQQHLSVVREALDEQVKAIEALGSVRSVEDLVALQQKVAGAQMERVMSYWSSVFQAAGQNQTETLGKVQQQLGRARDLFNDTYELTARATEEAASLAAAVAVPKSPPEKKRDEPVPPLPRRGSQRAPMHR